MTRQRVLLLVLAGLLALAGLGVTAFFVYASMSHATTPVPGDNRKLVVTADLLVPLGARYDPSKDKLETVTALDGTHTVEYSYSDAEGSPEGTQLFVLSNAFVLPNRMGAINVFHLQKFGMRGGLAALGETTTVPRPELITSGDAQYAATLLSEKTKRPIGNLILVRQGRVVTTLVLTGIALDDASAAEALMGPALYEAERRFAKR
jgi:hypothetical protein